MKSFLRDFFSENCSLKFPEGREKMSSNISNERFEDLLDPTNGFKSIPSYIMVYIAIFGLSSIVETPGNILVRTQYYWSRLKI